MGRASGEVRLEVVGHADRVTSEEGIEGLTLGGAAVYTDEWCGHDRMPERHRGHAPVCHAAGEWARDDDGDGIRAVHDNAPEGIWTGLRDFLRAFRGVSRWYLAQYVAIFRWGYNVERVTDDLLRCILGIPSGTDSAS